MSKNSSDAGLSSLNLSLDGRSIKTSSIVAGGDGAAKKTISTDRRSSYLDNNRTAATNKIVS